jgi:hypothetical protein
MTDEEFEGLARVLDATVRVKRFRATDFGYQVEANGIIEEDDQFPTHREAFDAAKTTFKKLLKIPYANN